VEEPREAEDGPRDPSRLFFSVQTGQVRSPGVEPDAHASLGNGLDLVFGSRSAMSASSAPIIGTVTYRW
jgi:hypothetical protein